MSPRIITGILLILLLTNGTTMMFNATATLTFANSSPTTENTINNLLKNVDFEEKIPDSSLSSTESMNFWDVNKINQKNTSISYWSEGFNEIIIGLTDSWGSYEKMKQLTLAKNGKIINEIFMGNKIEAVVINVPQDSVGSFITEVKENGLCTYAEPNLKYQAFVVPNDPYWDLQWGPVIIQANYAWDTTIGSNSVLVCVIDTGVDHNHPDLVANYVPLGYDWVNNDPEPMDDHGHGTHCSGIIGAVINNNEGIAGLAQVRLMAEKGLDASGSGYYDDLANAVIHATNQNASIISMSWGGSSPSTLLHNALKYAYDHGVLLVAAAGNSASSTKGYPAAYDEVIAVTATDPLDSPAWFTSFGDWVELAAPGTDIYSTISSIHDPRFNYPYDYMGGTSMACPHVAGVAALVWSQFPTMARDVLRLRLRDTTDDLGETGFDIYYGYGRVNARRAIEEAFPEHDIFIAAWKRPPYVEPGSMGIINATICNYGRYNETDVTVQLIVNGSIEQFVNISSFPSGTLTKVNLFWTPAIIGNYNITIYVPPVVDETNTENNVVQAFVFVDFPLKVFVLRSAGTQVITDAWEALNYDWQKYGDQLIYIDYTTLDKDNITYEDLKATDADVLILSCAYAWEYTDEEIEAIKQYVYEGHGFIVTAGTLYYEVPNNNKFAPMFGLNESIWWSVAYTDLLKLLEPAHPVLAGVPNPYTLPAIQTPYPSDGIWSSNELSGGAYIAMGYSDESAIVVYRGLVYISPWLEAIPERYHFNIQILYNAITWSQYEKPEHELKVSLDAPTFMFPNSTVLLNGTVTNIGSQNESNVAFQLSIYDVTRDQLKFFQNDTILLLQSDESYTISHLWNPTLQGLYNLTAYASPVLGEGYIGNNKVTILVSVTFPLIEPQEGHWASYTASLIDESTGQPIYAGEMLVNYSKYISSYQMNVTLQSTMSGSGGGNVTDWTVVNIMNRLCENRVWENLWFPGMIETNIIIGSEVNILYDAAIVNASETLVVGTKIVDCWKLYQSYMGYAQYTWWYDKVTGLWIRAELSYGSTYQIIMLGETNIPIGFTPEHELLVTLDAPSFVPLGNSSMLNATVFNLGLNNETNVDLILEINGTVVESLSGTELAINDSRMLSYLWTPLIEATYNVTAYSSPVPGENFTSDNVATAMVIVRTVKGYVLFDQTHSTDFMYSYNRWIMTLRTEGFVVDFHSIGNITLDVLQGYDAFVIMQAHLQYSAQELNAIRQFVANGGGLLVVGDDYPALYTELTAFADISWVVGGVSGYTTNITPHEVTQGVWQVYLSAPVSMLTVYSNARALVRDYYMEIMLAINWYQCGRVMSFADEDSLRDYNIIMADNLRLATNMIAWLCKEDTTPPTISYILPANGTVIGTPMGVVIQWGAIDSQSGIDKYSIYLNEQFVANTSLSSYLLLGLLPGSNNVTLVAYDRAGNHASGQVTLFVDIASPTMEILAPMNNSYVKGIVGINVSGYDENFDRMELYVDAKLVATFSTSGVRTYLWNTTSEYYAVHQLTLAGYDTAGNNASVAITVTVDNILPIAVISSPANNTYVRGNIVVSFIAQDLALKNASIKIDDGSPTDVTGSASMSFDTAALLDGNHTIKLVAYDWAGNKAETSVTITVDNTLPEAQINSPTNNAYVKGTVNLTFTFSDLNLQNATLFLTSRAFDVTTTTSHLWNTATLNDGSHMITLTVFDKAGNKGNYEITVTVDNTLPLGEIRAPLNCAYVRRVVNITFYGYDVNLKNVSLHIDGVVISPYSWNVSGIHSHSWDTTSKSDGACIIKLEIYDKVGNKFITTITVTVDNTSPITSIDSLQNGTLLSGKVTINFTVADTNLANAILFVDDVALPVTGQTSYEWDTAKLLDSDHAIKLVATDLAGNTKEVAITVKTTNALPIYVLPTITAVLGLAIGALIVWLLLKRKLAPPPAPTTTTSPTP